MKKIYFYYGEEDWLEMCSYLQDLNLDLYTYKGQKIAFEVLSADYLNGKWFVFVPKGVIPTTDKYGQIDEFPNAISFHTMTRGGKILPAVLFCNDGEIVSSIFKKIRTYISSNYIKTDSGREYISHKCYTDWLQYKVDLAGLIRFVQVESNPETFSFENFVKYVRQKGYEIIDPYAPQPNSKINITGEYYVVAPPEMVKNSDLDIKKKGISVVKKRRKGRLVYAFTMDYRDVYYGTPVLLSLFNDIKLYCGVD